jgi:hypothetical protein
MSCFVKIVEALIVDEEGIVKWVKVYPMENLPDINEVFDILARM